jgi:3-oxoacyl-[acyl-carrier-protein] synthase II
MVISEFFGKKCKRPYISAFKPYIGHNLGGSALIETIILLLSLQNNLIPPTLNCEDLDPRVEIEPIRELKRKELSIGLKMACGFAGYNAVSIFKKIKNK